MIPVNRPTAAPDCGTLLPSRALRAGAAADSRLSFLCTFVAFNRLIAGFFHFQTSML